MKGNGHIPIRFNRQAYAVSFILLCMRLYEIYAFQIPTNSHSRRVSCVVSLEKRDTIDSLWGPRVDDGEDEVLLSDTRDENGTDYSSSSSLTEEKKKRGVSRWASLNPTIKARIVKEGQERAIRNKNKREPKDARKRREWKEQFLFGKLITFLKKKVTIHIHHIRKQDSTCSTRICKRKKKMRDTFFGKHHLLILHVYRFQP
jgi:hypothetical protein